MHTAAWKACFMLGVALPTAAVAQQAFRDLDIGHPARIQNPSTPEALTLEILAPTAALELMPNGVHRWRTETGVALGLGWHTSAELFTPVVFRERSVSPRIGLAGAGLALMHVWNPAPALGLGLVVNSVLPVGSAASARTTYATRGLVSIDLGAYRLLANASAGTYAISGTAVCNPFIAQIVGVTCDGSSAPALPPCQIATLVRTQIEAVNAARVRLCPSSELRAASVPIIEGGRYQFAFGADRTFARQSTLVVANFFAERFDGLLPRNDLTAEIGVRRQLGSRLVGEGAAARHFAGNSVSWQLTAGFATSVHLR